MCIDTSLLVSRIALAFFMFPHGAQKLFGWFGGNGVEGTMQFMNGMLGVPTFIVWLVIIGEFFGSIALVLGLATRFSAASIGVIMIGAFSMVTWDKYSFGSTAGDAHIVAILLAVAILLGGAGKFSLDALVAGDCKKDNK